MITESRYFPRNLSPSLVAFALMLIATLLTSVGMVMNKILVMQAYPPSQIVLWRSIFTFIPLFFLVRRQGGLPSLKTQQAAILSFRGLMGFACMMAYCYSLEELSIFSAESLLYLEPIFVFVMAALLLRERIQKGSLSALGVALVGVLLIMRPGTDVASWGGVLAIAAAFFYASEIILTRFVGARDTAVTMFAYYSIVCFLGSALVTCMGDFVLPVPQDFLIFLFIAFVNLGINLAFTEALRRAPANQLAPLEYMTLAWVTLWQIQIWGEFPSLTVTVGALVILCSGLWILKLSLFQQKKKTEEQAPSPS